MMFKRFQKRLTEVFVYPEICKYQDGVANIPSYMSFLRQEAAGPAGMLIYIHVPYCESLCYFCNYFKEVFRKDAYRQRQDLFNAFVKELESFSRTPYAALRHVRAVQIGGGTPSIVEPEFIAQVMDAIRAKFDCRFEMVSMEGNVTSLSDPVKLRAFKDAGIERISFGIQTFNEKIRKKLRLKATVRDVYAAVAALNKAGFDDYSHDLMFNLPDQTMDDIRRDMDIVDREIRPTYLDCYRLNVMPNTMFNDALKGDGYCDERPSDEKELTMMRELIAMTKERGYRQVLSNVFSKRRERCVLTTQMTIDGSEAIGIGPSARGHLSRHGYRNYPGIDMYIKHVNEFGFSPFAGNIATEEEEEERRMVNLGNFCKVAKDEVPNLARFQPQLEFLYREGYAYDDGAHVRLTEEGTAWPGNISELFFNAKQRARRTRAMLQALRFKENPYNQDRMGVSASLYREVRHEGEPPRMVNNAR